MERLLEQTCSSMYWLGFIFADGWFDFNRHSIGVQVSDKDQDHLTKFCSFLNSSLATDNSLKSGFKASSDMVRTTKRSAETFNALVTTYGVQPRKTYNPPLKLIDRLEQTSDDMFISFMVGFFDGDGSLVSVPSQNSLTMRFQNHASWKFLLTYFEHRVYKIFAYNKPTPLTKLVTTKGGNETAMLVFARYDLVKDIFSKTKSLSLPTLTRKWEKVDAFFSIRQDKLRVNNKTSKRNKLWLDDEISLLVHNCDRMSIEELRTQFFPTRSHSSVSGKLRTLRGTTKNT